MIGTIRKHSKWLWLVIVTITIFSFVYWGSQTRGQRDSSGRMMNFGSIDGVPVTMEDYVQAKNEIELRYFIQNREWPSSRGKQGEYDEQREAYYRLFFIRKLEQNRIEVDNDSVAKVSNDILRNLGGDKPVDLNQFVKTLLAPRGMTRQDFQRFIKHDLAIHQLVSLLGLGGKLVTPEEARSLYASEFGELLSQVVYFGSSNHVAGIAAPSPDTLSQFYTNHEEAYRIPERVQVHYVEFSLTNVLADAEKSITNLNDLVNAYLDQLGTNFVRFGQTPEEARTNIRAGMIREKAKPALQEVRNQADGLVDQLLTTPDLAAVTKSNGLALRTSAPFTQEAGPAEFDGGPAFARVAFSLTNEVPFAEMAIEGPQAFYVVALAKRLPSEVPPLDDIRDRVVADYRLNQAKMVAWREAQMFVNTATNALAAGKSFDAICADAKVWPISLSPFSKQRGGIPQIENLVNPYGFKQTAFQIPVGKISEALPIDTGALVIHPLRLLPLDKARMDAEMPRFLNYLRQTRQNEAVNEWFAREAPRSLRNTPLRQEQAQPNAASPASQPKS